MENIKILVYLCTILKMIKMNFNNLQHKIEIQISKVFNNVHCFTIQLNNKSRDSMFLRRNYLYVN